MATPKTAFLFAQGSWHVTAHYQEFLDLVAAKGYKVVAPLLPSCQGRPFPDDPAEADITKIREAAMDLIGEGYEIVAMGHSSGGVVITGALYGLGVEERRKKGLQGGVRHLLYLAAFLLDEGHTCEMDAPVEVVKFCRYEGDEKVITPGYDMGEIMYPDLPVEQRKKWLDLLVPTPKALSFYTPKHFAYRDIHSVFIFCKLDAAYPYFAQVATVDAFHKKGVIFETETLETGHFPSLTQPALLADLAAKYLKL